MLKLFVASLIALSASTAHADQPSAPLPGIQRLPNCGPTTDVPTSLFLIHRDSTQIADFTSSTLNVLTNGAWTYQELQHGKVVRSGGDCLDGTQLKKLRDSLASATWSTSQAEFRCMAVAMDFTEYSYKGVLVLKSELCDGQILDEKTSKGLAGATVITNRILAGFSKTRTP